MNLKQIKQIKLLDLQPKLSSFKEEVINGLNAYPKYLSPKFFYDEEGSKLFELICQLDEYYPTRTEIGIIEDNMDEIAAFIGKKPTIIEFGSGASEKIRHIVDQIDQHAVYMAIDISKEFLIESANNLSEQYPHIDVYAICADFTKRIKLPQFSDQTHRVAFFPGSTIGNFDPPDALSFMKNSRGLLETGDGFLIGIDLHKKTELLEPAYNDAEGVTAQFNLNILNRMNSELDMDFNPDTFEHLAFYNQRFKRIEMHLRSKIDQVVSLEDYSFEFSENETIHTESSYKYTDKMMNELFRRSGFVLAKSWRDKDNLFSVNYLEAV
ncbi:MAG: L-histidine N(alpha)-methyltransferase [Calditrichaeota bacterium]|nr:L-histidine N(alpha)-methyltransferase [Calditrichota bacterium]